MFMNLSKSVSIGINYQMGYMCVFKWDLCVCVFVRLFFTFLSVILGLLCAWMCVCVCVCDGMCVCHHHHRQSLNCEGHWGTTGDFATSFLHFSLFSTAVWDLPNSRPVHSLMLSSMARILLCSSAVRVHESQTYRKMDVTRECISRILELREILLSIQFISANLIYFCK